MFDTCDLLRSELAADGIGVRLGGGRRTGTEVVHVSDLVSSSLEELQFVLGEGPAVTCFATGLAVQVPDTGAPEALGRWPGFIPEAARAGAAAILSLPLRVRGALLGTVTVHRRDCRPLVTTPSAGRLATRLASQMADVVMLADLGADQLGADRLSADHLSLDQLSADRPRADQLGADRLGADRWWERTPQLPELRPDVHVAAGMLSVKWGVGTEDALARLCATAFTEQRTVQQIARDVVARRRTMDLDGRRLEP